MALARTVKRLLFTTVIVSAGGIAAVHPEVITGFYEGIYPRDPAKRQALDLCFMQDHQFNRLEAVEREACYRRALIPPPAGTAATAFEPNAIDLRRAAAEGHLPRNDVRRREQTEEALHLSH